MNNNEQQPNDLRPPVLHKANVSGSTVIRYCVVQESLWYSLHDVVEFLRAKNAIDENRNIDFLFRKELSKKMAKGDCHYGFNCTLSIVPFDDFVNWVQFDLIYKLCLKSEVQKVKATHILQAIDINNLELIKTHYLSISECLKEVKLIEQ